MNATVAHISIPKVSEHVNGDAALVRRTDSGELLLAVIDGLGHGPNAAKATQAALSWLQTAALDAPLAVSMPALHAALRETRGVAATLLILRGDKLEGCAVGNVQFSCMNGTVPMVLSSGVLGQRLPKLRVCEAVLRPGCRIALFSDGISSKFRLDESRQLRPQQACELAMERHRKREDDATILIADLET
ncbi:MAG TPA: SpoIIE family protein phosphatase [Polyangiales bacterium]|nr:SpoIIE family protein phosphatase [Polyangiales bacterium]